MITTRQIRFDSSLGTNSPFTAQWLTFFYNLHPKKMSSISERTSSKLTTNTGVHVGIDCKKKKSHSPIHQLKCPRFLNSNQSSFIEYRICPQKKQLNYLLTSLNKCSELYKFKTKKINQSKNKNKTQVSEQSNNALTHPHTFFYLKTS